VDITELYSYYSVLAVVIGNHVMIWEYMNPKRPRREDLV
jgi:hypothetical protein